MLVPLKRRCADLLNLLLRVSEDRIWWANCFCHGVWKCWQTTRSSSSSDARAEEGYRVLHGPW
jgi:hypothetical protein